MSSRCAILFDLDGTLADTAPDLAWATNRVLEEEGLAPLPIETLRPAASHGAGGLLRHALGRDGDAERFERRRQRLVEHYRTRDHAGTRLFDGMDAVLAWLEGNGFAWGVVTNKPQALTVPLMERLGLLTRCAALVSGDTLPTSKPDPAPLLHACHLAQLDAAHTLYVGDAERDIQAGRHAGMRTVLALYGYLGPDDRWTEWQADATVETPDGLPAQLRQLIPSCNRP